MSWVKAKPGESFESLFRRFKKAVERAGILADYRKHEFYEKPSIKKRRKRAAAQKRAAKQNKKLARMSTRHTSSSGDFRWSSDRTKKLPWSVNRNRPNQSHNTHRGTSQRSVKSATRKYGDRKQQVNRGEVR